MQRRSFLTIAGGLLAAWAARALLPLRPALAVPFTRAQAWGPNPNVAFEWRYIAGRITAGADDYGFIVSFSRSALPGRTPELLVTRQPFGAGGTFVSASYPGTLAYDAPSATYTFQASGTPVGATMRLDSATQAYHLTVSSPELSLADVLLRTQGNLIAEGGDGLIDVGTIQGASVESDYYADWAVVEVSGVARGRARVDMQGLRPQGLPTGVGGDYDHHWFAVTGTLATDSGPQPVWVSAWRIVAGGTFWNVTIALGANPWNVTSIGEAGSAAQPLTVAEQAWQPVVSISGTPVRYTGTAWHLAAGALQAGDLLDLTITVPAGQLVGSGRLVGGGVTSFLEEGVGVAAAGTVLGKPLSDVRLVVAESTAEFALQHVPLVRS